MRTNSANYGREPRVQCEPETFYAIKRGPYTCLGITQYRNDFHKDSKRRKKPTQCTCYKNTTKLHVSVAAAIICTILGLRICLINELTRRKKTLSKILPSPTYMEITKNSIYGYKLQQAIRQLHVGYLHNLRTSKKILTLLLIVKSLKNA